VYHLLSRVKNPISVSAFISLAEFDVARPIGPTAQQLVQHIGARARLTEEAVGDETRDAAAQRPTVRSDDLAFDFDAQLGLHRHDAEHGGIARQLVDQALLDRLVEGFVVERLRRAVLPAPAKRRAWISAIRSAS
jgi:hypothetical protein